jgi:hypothetical protein
MPIKSWKRMMAATLCLFLAESEASLLMAQAAANPPRILITILDGEGALNNIKARTVTEPIIQVEDENHKPIAGAAVIFLLPDSGPSGTFLDGTHMLSTETDSAGRASAKGLRPNHVTGKYEIHVKVSYNGNTSETTIHQSNVSGTSGASEHAARAVPTKGILIGVGVAAAAAGILAGILATRGGHSTTITAGPPTVGAP